MGRRKEEGSRYKAQGTRYKAQGRPKYEGRRRKKAKTKGVKGDPTDNHHIHK